MNIEAINKTLVDIIDHYGIYFTGDQGNFVQLILNLTHLIFCNELNHTNDVSFTLYTRANQKGELLVVNDVESIKKSKFNPKKDSFLIAHGWLNSKNSTFSQLVKNGMHNRFIVVINK